MFRRPSQIGPKVLTEQAAVKYNNNGLKGARRQIHILDLDIIGSRCNPGTVSQQP